MSFDTEQMSTTKTINESQDGSDGVRLKLFDLVLVDAECSTDGSVIHIQKRFAKAQQNGIVDSEESAVPRYPRSLLHDCPMMKTPCWSNNEQLSQLVVLQRNLASTGFRLLQRGGFMVYSTCSLSEEQNEGVVKWLLSEFPDAKLVPIAFPSNSENLKRPGSIPGWFQWILCDFMEEDSFLRKL